MNRRPVRQWQSAARLIGPVEAERVFDEWADAFEIESGWSSGTFSRRRRAKVSFSRGAEAYVYFAIAQTGPIKIGLSKQPLLRVRSFPGYEILVAVPGQDSRGEFSVHAELVDFRRSGRQLGILHGIKHEWFHRESTLVSLLYRLANAANSQLTLAHVGVA